MAKKVAAFREGSDLEPVVGEATFDHLAESIIVIDQGSMDLIHDPSLLCRRRAGTGRGDDLLKDCHHRIPSPSLSMLRPCDEVVLFP